MPRLVPTLGPAKAVTAVAFSRNGNLIVTGGGDGIAILWDLGTGSEVRRFTVSRSSLTHVQFFDHDLKILTGSADGFARVWDTASGKQLRNPIEGFVGTLSHGYIYGDPFAVSPDSRMIFTADNRHVAHLWDAETGREKSRLPPRSDSIGHVAFSSTGRLLLVAGLDGTKLYDLSAGRELWSVSDTGAVAFGPKDQSVLTAGAAGMNLRDVQSGQLRRKLPLSAVWTVAFSPNSNRILAGTYDKTTSLWNSDTGDKLWEVGGGERDTAVAFSTDGTSFAVASANAKMGSWDGKVTLRDSASLKETQVLEGLTNKILSVGFYAGYPYVLGADKKSAAYLFSEAADQTITRFDGHLAPVIEGALSPNGQSVLLGSLDNSASMWNVASGEEAFHFLGHTQYIAATAFSQDNRYAYTSGGAGFKWDTKTGSQIAQIGNHSLEGAVLELAPTPNNRYVFARQLFLREHRFTLWDTVTGKAAPLLGDPRANLEGTFSKDGRLVMLDCAEVNLRQVRGDTGVKFGCQKEGMTAFGLSPDGKYIYIGTSDGTAYVLDAQTGSEVEHFRQEQSVGFISMSEGNKFLMTASVQDNITHLWRMKTPAGSGRELCRIATFQDGTWIVVDMDGRFDTNSIEGIRGISWIFDDNPLTPLPLEIFMRDYYTPQLLKQVIEEEKLPAIPSSISKLNRVQPLVSIISIEPESAAAGTVCVTTEVVGVERQYLQDGVPVTRRTGVRDVRLFRDGQIVAYAPAAEGLIQLDSGTNKALIKFCNIRLPSTQFTRQVEFSAYAFNDDRVKSKSYKSSFEIGKTSSPNKGTAYVVVFGVNTFQNTSWNLKFAANDARATRNALTKRLKGQFNAVVPVTLVSDSEPVSDEATATKRNLEVVLKALSGKPPSIDDLSGIPHLAQVQKAVPQDVVILSMSSHGFVDDEGTFYCLPSDTGVGNERQINKDLLKNFISSEELTAWLRDIDAGELIMILDACHSAAIKGEDFKPGPMGSRSLGQLAYDKKMRLLAATQSDSVALEFNQLQHGILTYALIQNGIENGRADYKPKDKVITVSEWLSYGAYEVPRLHEDISSGRIKVKTDSHPNRQNARDLVITPVAYSDKGKSKSFLQHPALFNFKAGHREILISGTLPFDSPGLPADADPATKRAAEEAELKAAIGLQDPVVAAGAIRKFVAKYPHHPLLPAARLVLVTVLLESGGPSLELISACRMAIAYLELVHDVERVVLICKEVAEELTKRSEYPDVAFEFADMAVRLVAHDTGAGFLAELRKLRELCKSKLPK